MAVFQLPIAYLSDLFSNFLTVVEICKLDTALCNFLLRRTFLDILNRPCSVLQSELLLVEIYIKNTMSLCMWLAWKQIKVANCKLLFETGVGLHDQMIVFQPNGPFSGIANITIQYYSYYNKISGDCDANVGCGELSYSVLRSIAESCPNITTLTVKNCKLPYYPAPVAIWFMSLMSIILHNCRNASVLLEDLLSMAPNCTSVALSNAVAHEAEPNYLKVVIKPIRNGNSAFVHHAVTSLSFHRCDFVSLPLCDVVRMCPNVTTLSLRDNTLDDVRLHAVAQRASQLTGLSIENYEDEVTYNGIYNALNSCNNLQRLELTGKLGDVNEENLVSIAATTSLCLRELRIGLPHADDDPEFHDAWLKNILVKAPQLSSLRLSHESELDFGKCCPSAVVKQYFE